MKYDCTLDFLTIAKSLQLCPTLCDPMDCSLPGFSIQGILQARILQWVTISFSRGSSWPRDRTRVSHIGGRRFNLWATYRGKESKKEWIYVCILEKEMAAHSSIIAWRIPWTEEPGGLQSVGSHRVRRDWATNAHAIYMHNWLTFLYAWN